LLTDYVNKRRCQTTGTIRLYGRRESLPQPFADGVVQLGVGDI
jgi:hypothetical protein